MKRLLFIPLALTLVCSCGTPDNSNSKSVETVVDYQKEATKTVMEIMRTHANPKDNVKKVVYYLHETKLSHKERMLIVKDAFKRLRMSEEEAKGFYKVIDTQLTKLN